MSSKVLRAAAAATRREQVIVQRAMGYPIRVPELPDKLEAIMAAVEVFDELGVPYALIGGLAVGIHSGIPRATLDVDFAVATSLKKRAAADPKRRRSKALRDQADVALLEGDLPEPDEGW